MPDERKTEKLPCHIELWEAIDRLDGSVSSLRGLHERLIGSEKEMPDVSSSPPPSFAVVLEESARRVQKATEKTDNLRQDFESLCFQGRTREPFQWPEGE